MKTLNSCITGVRVDLDNGPLILLTAYMPTEYNDEDSLEKYIDVCAHLSGIVTDCDSPHVMIIGDFNCQPDTRFFKILKHLTDDNNLMFTDMSLLAVDDDVFTYCSDNGCNTSWIDHVICSNEINFNVCDLSVLYDFSCSDHRPLSFNLNCKMLTHSLSYVDVDLHRVTTYDWSRVDDYSANLYSVELCSRLSEITIPDCLRKCCYSKLMKKNKCLTHEL